VLSLQEACFPSEQPRIDVLEEFMFRMSQQLCKRFILVVCSTILVAPLAYAQSGPLSNAYSEADLSALKYQYTTPTQVPVLCHLLQPGQVQRFRITCNGTHKVDVKTADCCIEGDHWQLKIKAWDSRPNTAVTTSPGGVGQFGVVGRIYTYNALMPLDALLECSYLHGVNVFPADTNILLEHSSGTCTVTDLGISDLIDRSP
jgi:hypothetical protein